jgi:hypothetical protein
MIMTSSSLKKISDNKVIPIVRENSEPKVPTFLKSKLYIDFSKEEDIEFALDELLRAVLNAPLFVKPDIGKSPFRPLSEARPDRTSDGIKELMITFVRALNNSTQQNLHYVELIKTSTMPRILLDKYFNEAEKKGLVSKSTLYIHITDKGFQYVEDHDIINA